MTTICTSSRPPEAAGRGVRQEGALTPDQRELAARGLEAARRSVWRRAPAVAAVVGVGLDDLRQEAYLAACLAARSFAGPGDFACYAAVAARNRLRMMCRAAGEQCRQAQLVPLDGLDAEPHRDPRRARRGLAPLRVKLRQLARGLPERQREALGLHLSGLNNCQVARELGLNEATVRIHLQRAVESLRAKVLGSCLPELSARPRPVKRLPQKGEGARSVEARSEGRQNRPRSRPTVPGARAGDGTATTAVGADKKCTGPCARSFTS